MELYRGASQKLAAIVFFIGLLVLVGWIADIALLKSVFPNIVTMKVNTALCFTLLGASLWSVQRNQTRAAQIMAVVALTIGTMTLCEYAFGWDLQIDQFFFEDPPDAIMTTSPGRMAANSAICFILLGAAIILASIRSARTKIAAQTLFGITGFISVLALLGYIYGLSTFYIGIARLTAMAIHTALAFTFLAIGGLLALPETGFMRILTMDSDIGRIARNSIVIVSLIVVGTDMLSSIGVKFLFYDDRFAAALHATIMLAAFYITIIVSAYISGTEERRKKTLGFLLSVSERKYRDLYESSADAITTLEPFGRFLGANPAALRIFGCKDEAEFLTKTPADLSPKTQPDGESSADKAQRMMAIALEKGSHFFEWKHQSVDGREFWATVLLTKIVTDGKTFLQSTVRDINLQKTQEIELEKRMDELERFNTITLGREQRIIELKDKIKALTEELKK